MKKGLRVLLTTGLLGCASNMAPQVCDAGIPRVETHVSATFHITACFTDDSEVELVHDAVSSNTAVAYVIGLQRNSVELYAKSRGSAIITLIGTDSEGLSGRYDVEVEVSNRAPEAVDRIGHQLVERGDYVTIKLADYFVDLDGQSLKYSATVGDPAIAAAATKERDRLRVTGVGAGSTTIQVTATDPDGDTATQDFELSVSDVQTTLIFEDEFSEFSNDWEIRNGVHSVSDDGILSLWSEETNQVITAKEIPATKLWRFETRARRTQNTGTAFGFGSLGLFKPYGYYLVLVTDDEIWFLVNEYDDAGGRPIDSHIWRTPNAFTTVGEYSTISIENDLLRGVVIEIDGTEVFTLEEDQDTEGIFPRIFTSVAMIAADLENPDAESATKVDIDWIKVYGAPAQFLSDSESVVTLPDLKIRN